MPFSQERVAAANLAYRDTLRATITASLSGVTRPAEPDRHPTSAVLADVARQLKALSAARDLRDVPLLDGPRVAPGIDRTVVYLRSLQEIAREVERRWEGIVEAQWFDSPRPGAEPAIPSTGVASSASPAAGVAAGRAVGGPR